MVSYILNFTLIDRLEVNYGNTLQYSFSVRDCPSPENGMLCIWIVDIILKSAVVLLYQWRASKHHIKKSPCYSWAYFVQDNTLSNIGYCRSTFKTAEVSDWYCSHLYICDTEQNKVNHELLSIDLLWYSYFSRVLDYNIMYHCSSHQFWILDLLEIVLQFVWIKQRII